MGGTGQYLVVTGWGVEEVEVVEVVEVVEEVEGVEAFQLPRVIEGGVRVNDSREFEFYPGVALATSALQWGVGCTQGKVVCIQTPDSRLPPQ